MDIKRVLVQAVLLSALALVGFGGITHGKQIGTLITADLYVNPVGEVSSAATRALKSVQKISKGFSSGSVESFALDSRHLLAAKSKKSAPCEWEDGVCDVSDRKTLQLLTSASSDIAQFALQILECTIVTSEKECSEPACAWEDGECSAGDSVLGPEALSDCMGDAALFLEFGGKDEMCKAAFTSDVACNANDDCTWDKDEGACKFDIFKVLIGVPSVDGRPAGFNEVLEVYKDWLLATSLVDGIATTEDLDEILEWDPKPFKCPNKKDQLSCDLVVATQEIFVNSIYCSRKFPDGEFSPKACNADPLCEVDEDDECSVSQKLEDDVERRILTEFIESIENPLIREILIPFFTCSRLKLPDCKGMCVWNAGDEECDADGVAMAKSLGKNANANPKPVCQILGAVFESGCISAPADKCRSNPSCEIDEEGDCGPKEMIFGDVVMKSDKAFKKAYKKASKICKVRKSKKACE